MGKPILDSYLSALIKNYQAFIRAYPFQNNHLTYFFLTQVKYRHKTKKFFR